MRRAITFILSEDLSSVTAVEVMADTAEEQAEMEAFGARVVDLFVSEREGRG